MQKREIEEIKVFTNTHQKGIFQEKFLQDSRKQVMFFGIENH